MSDDASVGLVMIMWFLDHRFIARALFQDPDRHVVPVRAGDLEYTVSRLQHLAELVFESSELGFSKITTENRELFVDKIACEQLSKPFRSTRFHVIGNQNVHGVRSFF